jgi:hypothetical protein
MAYSDFGIDAYHQKLQGAEKTFCPLLTTYPENFNYFFALFAILPSISSANALASYSLRIASIIPAA